MPSRHLRFDNGRGHVLAAILDEPDEGTTRAHALFAHCFTCSKDLKAIHRISRALSDEGIAVLRFDFTGLGQSEGDFADSTFSANVADLVAAAQFLTREFDAPSMLIGHSLGGAAVLRARASIPSVRAVATIAAPSDPSVTKRHFGAVEAQLQTGGEAEIEIMGRRFRINRDFVDDLDGHRMHEAIESLDAALMVLHSPEDTIVGIDHASAIFKAARHPKSFVSLGTADHLLTNPADARAVAKIIAVWAMWTIGPFDP